MYNELIQLVKRATVLGSANGLLEWDHLVMMPKGEIARRSEQMTLLASLTHQMCTAPRIGELLSAIDRSALNDAEKANVEEIEFSYNRSTKIPQKLIEEATAHSIKSNDVWEKARENNDFASFRPSLERTIELCREMALAIDPSSDPYETMIENYERGASVAEFSRHFKEIADGLAPLVREIGQREKMNTAILDEKFDEDTQMEYLEEMLGRIGYDFNKGRLDTATHPFCGEGGRITTRFTDGWYKAVGSAIHEHGHAMYEHQLPEADWGTPLGTHRSMGVHESQSRLWENHVGMSKDFWIGEYPRLQFAYAPFLADLDLDTFHRYINAVEPGFIRVNADELTYPMHITLRFEFEQALVSGSLKAADLPGAWQEKMQKYLGITPPSDSLGCLQDIHWTGGFGYFPTYTYGSMIAAQLWEALEKSVPDVDQQMRDGKFEAISGWLKDNVHRHGCRYSTAELIERATGAKPSSKAYVGYLTKKFGALYKI